MVEINEETKKRLLQVVASVEASLDSLREAIEKGELKGPYSGMFHTQYMGKLPNGEILDTVTLTRNRAIFSFIGTVGMKT